MRTQLRLLHLCICTEDGIGNRSCTFTDYASHPIWRPIRQLNIVSGLARLAEVLVANLLCELWYPHRLVADCNRTELLVRTELPGWH